MQISGEGFQFRVSSGVSKCVLFAKTEGQEFGTSCGTSKSSEDEAVF